MIHYKTGDATRPDERNAVLVHCCNNIGRWGSGFVLAVDRQFGDWIGQHYREQGDYPLGSIGKFFIWHTEPGTVRYVVNLIGQAGVRSRTNPTPVDYEALAVGLARVDQWMYDRLAFDGQDITSIVMPRIGCGLAGGKWSRVEAIINKTILSTDVYVYDLPGAVAGKDWNP